MAQAVRSEDPHALITVGMFPTWEGFNANDIASAIDFASVHLYPASGQLDASLDLLRQFDVGKPVLIEELGPLACSVPELESFIARARPLSAGALGFYWGQTPAELESSREPRDGFLLAWLQMLQRTRP